MLAKTIRYPFNSLIFSFFLNAVNPLTPRIAVVWSKKKWLEDPKFNIDFGESWGRQGKVISISTTQKGAILRVSTLLSLIVAKVTPVFKKGARKDVNNYFVLSAFQEKKASRMLNGKLPLPRIGSGYPILWYRPPQSWIVCHTKTRLDRHVIWHIFFVDMAQGLLSAA